MSELIATLIIIINNKEKTIEYFKEELITELNVPDSYLTISKLIKDEDDFKIKFHIDFEKTHSIKYIHGIIDRFCCFDDQNWNSLQPKIFDFIIIDYNNINKLKKELNEFGFDRIYSCSFYTNYKWPLQIVPTIPYSEYERSNISIAKWVQNQ